MKENKQYNAHLSLKRSMQKELKSSALERPERFYST
jgi:hypothetical protein